MNGLNKFTSKEERLLLSLAMVVLIGIVFFYIVNKFDRPDVYRFQEVVKENSKSKNVNPNLKYPKNEVEKKNEVDKEKHIAKFSFNPNKISKDSLMMLGVDSRTASNLVKYREKGGKIKNEEKFFKIYGMEDYKEQLSSLLTFEESVTNSANSKKDSITSASSTEPNNKPVTSTSKEPNSNSSFPVESALPPKEKYTSKPMKVIEVNGADSLQLQTVRGIGWYLASKIVKYRDRYGGFYDIHQLEEMSGMHPDNFLVIKEQLKIDLTKINKININTADAKKLGSHPYIGYKYGEITVRYRNNHGKFKSMEDVAKVRVFDQETLDKLKYYLSFD